MSDHNHMMIEGDRIFANLDTTRAPVPGTLHAVEGDYGLGWCIVEVDVPAPDGPTYFHVPLNRCRLPHDVADWRERNPGWRCPECGADRGDGYCQACGRDRD